MLDTHWCLNTMWLWDLPRRTHMSFASTVTDVLVHMLPWPRDDLWSPDSLPSDSASLIISASVSLTFNNSSLRIFFHVYLDVDRRLFLASTNLDRRHGEISFHSLPRSSPSSNLRFAGRWQLFFLAIRKMSSCVSVTDRSPKGSSHGCIVQPMLWANGGSDASQKKDSQRVLMVMVLNRTGGG